MIRLQFATQRDPISSLIRFATHGWASHVDIVLASGELLGARFSGGVAIRPADYARFSRRLVVELPCTSALEGAFYGFALAQVGRPYDLTADLAFAVNRDWREPDAWMCSELVAAGLDRAGFFAHRLLAPTNRITPATLLLILSSHVDVPQI